MPDDQPAATTRKNPTQNRAKQTMETILEATAQILSEHGSERLTTNFLARKAGFSVGTIYQYFPNREAIVLALIARQREEVGRRIRSALENDQKRTAEEKIGQIVHVLHEAFNVHRMPHRRLVQALMRVAAAQGLPSPPHIAAQAIIEVWREAGEDAAQPPNESEAFVLSRSVIEVLRQATLESSPLLGTAEFEQAILRLVLGFLREAGAG